MYMVVEFSDNGGLAAVHSSWLTPLKKEVFWPPYKDQQRMHKALRSAEPVNEENWALYKISRIFYANDDLLKVRQKLKDAEITSNVDTEEDSKSRKRKPSKRLISSSDEDSDTELPRPPILKRRLFIKENTQTPSCINSLQPQNVCEENSFAPSTSKNNSAVVTRNFQLESVLEKLVNTVSHIKEQNELVLTWITNQEQNSRTGTILSGLPADMPFEFPLKSIECFDEFDKYITEHPNNFNSLVSHLRLFGGRTLSNKVNRILKYLVVDLVICQFSYHGQRNNKRPFSGLTTKNLIIDSVKGVDMPGITNKEIEDCIKVWIRHASDRLKKSQTQ